MKKMIFVLIIIFASANVQMAQEKGTQTAKKQFLYLLRLDKSMWEQSAWTPEKNKIVLEHFSRLQKMLADGILILGGRTQNELNKTFGIVIYEAGSFEEAKKIAEDDPAVKAGIMTVEVFPYSVALSKCDPSK